MSTDLSDKSNDFRHGYLTCVEDMRQWFLAEQARFDAERTRLKRKLNEEKKNFKRRHYSRNGYRAGVADILSFPLRQIADLKRQLKSDGDLSPVVALVRASSKERLRERLDAVKGTHKDFDDAVRELMASQQPQESTQ